MVVLKVVQIFSFSSGRFGMRIYISFNMCAFQVNPFYCHSLSRHSFLSQISENGRQREEMQKYIAIPLYLKAGWIVILLLGSKRSEIVLYWLNLLFLFVWVFFWPCLVAGRIYYFPDQGLNLCPVQWKHGVLTAGLPGNSRLNFFKKEKEKNI